MSGARKDYYASLVSQSSSQDKRTPFAVDVPLKKSTQPYRSNPQGSLTSFAETTTTSTTTTAFLSGSNTNPSLPSSTLSTLQRPVVAYETYDAQLPPKYYQHNPYAAACTTPLIRPALAPEMDSTHSVFLTPYNPCGSSLTSMTPAPTPTMPLRVGSVGGAPHTLSRPHPVYGVSEASGVTGEACVVTASLEEQFCSVIGNIPATAMSSRGRHLLLSVLRLRHIDKIQIVYDEIAPQFNKVAVDQHGCHVVRTLIELITTAQMEALVPCMEPAVVLQMAIATQHTRRVLQAVFEHHKTDALMPLVDVVRSDCMRLSMNQQGCIVIIRVIEYALPTQKKALISELVPILPALAEDQFGNYVVQCILKNMDGYVSFHELVESFQGHWVKLSCDKYSSNVMERIIGMLRDNSRQRIVKELIFDEDNLQQLMQNSYGNYVLQAIIGTAVDHFEFTRIVDSVRPFLHTSPYGHRIDAKLKSRFDVLSKTAPLNSAALDAPTK